MSKNIAILISSLADGGAQRVASNLSLHFPEEINLYLFLNDGQKIDYPYKGQIVDLETSATRNPLKKITNFLKRIYRVRKYKRKYNIDTTISFLPGPNIINLLSNCGDKVIISERNFPSKKTKGFYSRIYAYLKRLIYNQADIIVAVSKLIKKDLADNFNLKEEKIRVIYNPYDIEGIRNLSCEEIETEYQEIFKNPVVINVGSLSEQKGQWHLIRSFKKVKQEIPKAQLIILGKGKLKNHLKSLANDLGIQDDIHFLGFQNNPFKFVKKADVFILSSLYEGFPNVLAESMACGVPVISTDCKSGPREILAPNTNISRGTREIEYAEYGILVPVCDGNKYQGKVSLTREETLLAYSIIKIFKDNDLRDEYSIFSRKRVKDFRDSQIISKWLEIINK